MAARRIPPILHQSWKSTEIPYHIYPKSWIDSWALLHPDWERILWTDEDNERLVRDRYPQFHGFYQSLTQGIKRADFSRLLYMHHQGGVYVDLDFVALKPLAPLLDSYDIVLGRLSGDNDYYQIPNAFLASSRGNDFWLAVAQDAAKAPPHEQDVERLAGPFRLQWAFHLYQPENAAVFGDEQIYPFDWIHFTHWRNGYYFREDRKRLATLLRDLTPSEMAAYLPRSYCVTFWTHNW